MPVTVEPPRANPKSAGLDRQYIRSLAEDIACQLDFGPGTAIERIVERLGGEVETRLEDEFDDVGTGSIVVRAAGDFTISVSEELSASHRRYVIAHELGHYFLHFLMLSERDQERGLRAGSMSGGIRAIAPEVDALQIVEHEDPADWGIENSETLERVKQYVFAEREAIWFAVSFLMPATKFQDSVSSMNNRVAWAAAEFTVSPARAERYLDWLTESGSVAMQQNAAN